MGPGFRPVSCGRRWTAGGSACPGVVEAHSARLRNAGCLRQLSFLRLCSVASPLQNAPASLGCVLEFLSGRNTLPLLLAVILSGAQRSRRIRTPGSVTVHSKWRERILHFVQNDRDGMFCLSRNALRRRLRCPGGVRFPPSPGKAHTGPQQGCGARMRGYVVFWWSKWNSPRFLRRGKGLRAFHLVSFCRPQVEHKWNRYRLVPPAYPGGTPGGQQFSWKWNSGI